MTSLERLTHIVLIARLEYIAVRVMIDYGANRNYVLTRVANALRDRARYKDNPYSLTIVDGTPVDYDGG